MTELYYYVTGTSLSGESGNTVNLFGVRVVDCKRREVVFELADITTDCHRIELFIALCSESHVELPHLDAFIDDFFWHG